MSDENITEVDLCVIGAGSGGLTVAAVASQLGAPVALIEKGEMGGDCLNYGCVPSKALLAAARRAENMRGAGPFGLGPVEPEVDWAAVKEHVRKVIEQIRPMDDQPRFEALGVKVFRGTARFLDKGRVMVNGQTIRARRFVIATGSTALIPPVNGLEASEYFTNETIFSYSDPIDHLIILGAGPIGLEMAQAHRRLGARVTVLEMARALPREDGELSAVVLNALRREGVEILEGARVVEARGRHGAVHVTAEIEDATRVFSGSHLLVATGRRPNLEDLDLDAAGIDYDSRGIKVDKGLRSSNKKVYAIGDVNGGPQFTHAAGHQGGLVIQNALFRIPVRFDARNIPRVTYCEPELAHVGLMEEEARAEYGDIRILRSPLADVDRAVAEHYHEGMIKVIVAKNGRILGASIVGSQAGELILPWALALKQKLKIGAMAGLVVPYPTLGDLSRRAASSFFITRLLSKNTLRLVRFLRRFG